MFSSGPDTEISASGIDNALDALSLATSNNKPKIDRHPERRFKAAFTAYKDANIDRIKKENPGLNFTQREKILYEEFKKHPDNPFNQESIAYNASVNDIAEKKKEIKQNLSNKYESGI
ncbi:hypothetical protein PACTADRAFT_45220 [Pachysolen tannophilus NRRL Y-2460]|uniref:Coiled-coil domain-containing protein n=1 Tax=Pachysolen tannophilus NRRL Y-2460 TaxID=669874 RepID=A0A1E4TQS8_PACTA|nr:hypothetical protein PACTADRAFT_45220 [Pachysolen tannophilus NRRL Y-2460]